jgi:hypothetical protein
MAAAPIDAVAVIQRSMIQRRPQKQEEQRRNWHGQYNHVQSKARGFMMNN